MKARNHPINSTPEKDRIRAEIEAQVEAFLQKGGQINVHDTVSTVHPVQTGSVWPNRNDVLGMID